ncbi:MAG: hypothetical protein ACRC8S_07270 [Fimbriiglobus sp.]
MSPLDTAAEREAILAGTHPIFREVDAAFHAYLEVLLANPTWKDDAIEQELLRRGISPSLAADCVIFGPMAFGREIAERLGMELSPTFRLHSLIDETETELPLAKEIVYSWARAMIGVYHNPERPERTEVLRLVCERSSEYKAINNALYAGETKESLRQCRLQPTLVYLRRPGQE